MQATRSRRIILQAHQSILMTLGQTRSRVHSTASLLGVSPATVAWMIAEVRARHSLRAHELLEALALDGRVLAAGALQLDTWDDRGSRWSYIVRPARPWPRARK